MVNFKKLSLMITLSLFELIQTQEYVQTRYDKILSDKQIVQNWNQQNNLLNQEEPIPDVNSLVINSESQTCGQKNYNLKAGYYQLSFQMMGEFLDPSVNIPLNIVWNNLLVATIPPVKDSEFYQFKYKILVNQGDNKFKVCPAMIQSLFPHHHFLINIQLQYLQCNINPNLITNGDFQQNLCLQPSCLYNSSNYNPLAIPGWFPSPHIEIGLSYLYNIQFPNVDKNWVLQLKPQTSNCIKQKLTLTSGSYILQFIYAPSVPINSSKFHIKINDKIIKQIVPVEFCLQSQKVQFHYYSNQTETWLEFCTYAEGERLGAVIDDVTIVRKGYC